MTEAATGDGISLRLIARVVSVEGVAINGKHDLIVEGGVIKVGDLIGTGNNGTVVIHFDGLGDIVIVPDRVILFDELFWGNLDYLIRLKYIPKNWSATLGADTEYEPEFDNSVLHKTGVGGSPASVSSQSSIASGTRFETSVQQTIPYTDGPTGVLPARVQTVKKTDLNTNREQEISSPHNVLPAKVNGSEGELLPIRGLSVFDAGGDLQSIQLSVLRGVVAVELGASVTIIAGANGSKEIVIAGSQNQLNNVLSTLLYLPDRDFSGTDHLIITSRDSTGEVFQDVDALTINIQASSDNASIDNTGNALVYIEGDTDTMIDGSRSISNSVSLEVLSIGSEFVVNDVEGEPDILDFNGGLSAINYKALIDAGREKSPTYVLQMSDVFSDSYDSQLSSVMDAMLSTHEFDGDVKSAGTSDSAVPYFDPPHLELFFDELQQYVEA